MTFGFDPSLMAQLAGRQQTQLRDPLETVQSLGQLAEQRQQGQLNQLKLAEMARQQQRQAQLEGLYQQNGGKVPPELLARLGFGDEAREAEKHTVALAQHKAVYEKAY